jgi:DNA-binding NarL/FixJ family response regulator
MTRHIMIVEDNPLLRETIKEILKVEFPTVIISEAFSGETMWHILNEQLPDLIFMDIKLAEENGLELTREIKAKHPDVVIAIFTNHDLPEYRQKASICGAEFFLSKFDCKVQDLTKLASTILNQPRTKQ